MNKSKYNKYNTLQLFTTNSKQLEFPYCLMMGGVFWRTELLEFCYLELLADPHVGYVDSGMREIFAFEVQHSGLRDLESAYRNLESR